MSNKTNSVPKGGSFLIVDVASEQVFTPEDYSDEHKLIAKTTEEFVINQVLPEVEHIENHEFDRSVKLLEQAGELGLLAADVPEEYGGLGLDKISSALIAEKLARAGAFSITHGAHVGIGTLPIVLFGNEKQKQNYLPLLATGEKISAYALTEPGSGSDALGAKTTAKLNPEGTHYILNAKRPIFLALATKYFSFANGSSPGSAGINSINSPCKLCAFCKSGSSPLTALRKKVAGINRRLISFVPSKIRLILESR